MADQEQLEILRKGVEAWNSFVEDQADGFRANFIGAHLAREDLARAYLSEADLTGATLTDATLTEANLVRARLTAATVDGATVDGATLDGADLSYANLTGANLTGANLTGANLTGANLTEVNLYGARLKNGALNGARLAYATLTKATLSRANLHGANLYGARLTNANLTGARLTNANLDNANLSGARLANSNLYDADLRSANLTVANLAGANLAGADLSYACIVEGDLTGAHLINSNLTETDFTRCQLGRTAFSSVNLSIANGLTSFKFLSSSPISTDSLALSAGRIPEVFLKGCGLADWEILNARLYDPDLTRDEFIDTQYEVFRLKHAAPVQAGQVFISYSRKDDTFVDELYTALDRKGIRSWRDLHDAEAGPLDKVLDRAIRLNPIMLLVLSKHSVSSGWVGYEIEKAVELEAELDRPVLFPVALDDAWLATLRPDLRSQVKRYAVLDLSGEGAIQRKMPKILEGLQVHYRDTAD